MKYLLTLILVASIITGFSQKKVRYGAKEKYYLSDDEKQITIDDKILEEYDPYNNNLEHQLPLQRYIKAPNYKLYIGLALYDTPTSMMNLYKNDVNNYSILQIDSVKVKRKYFYKIYTKYNGEYNYKIIFKTRKSHYTTVLNFTSDNRELLQSFYDDPKFFKKKLHKRIKKNN